jgi:hypothetical protein
VNTEGRGIVAPASIVIKLGHDELLIINERAASQALERDYKNRRDSWGTGLTGPRRPSNALDLRDDQYPGFVGLVGEYALCSYINRKIGKTLVSLDLKTHQYGDRGVDVTANGLTIQIKTRQNRYQPNLIRVTNGRGESIPFNSQIYAFCLYLREEADKPRLLGWTWTREIVGRPIVDARRGNHKNIEIPDRDLKPMTRLIQEIRRGKDTD